MHTMLFVLVASGCADYVFAPQLTPEREPRVGEIDVAPSGALWVLEPLEGSSRGIRRYDGARIAETVPLPEAALTAGPGQPSAELTLVALDDRVFVGALDPWNGTRGLVTLWQWDGAAWTDLLSMFGGSYVRASRPLRDGSGATWITAGAQVARLEADGTWTIADLPDGLETSGVVAPLPEGVRVVASDASYERASIVDVASDLSAEVIGTLPRDPRVIEAVGVLGDRPVVVGRREYRQQIIDLEDVVLAELHSDAEMLDACNASDGALWILVREYLYERFLAVRVDETGGLDYAGEVADERTAAYDAVTHLAPGPTNGVWLYGAGIYHATPSVEP